MRYDAGMGVELLTKRHKDQIVGVLSCYDRILIQGTVPGWCYARGMTDYFYKHQLRIFDYPKWAEPLRQELRQNLERIAAENALPIEFVRSRKSFRKEDRVKQILEKRGEQPGVVCILSALEPCGSYKPWHDKPSHKTYLKPDDGKCFHYYVYFLDDDLGLCSLRLIEWYREDINVQAKLPYLSTYLGHRDLHSTLVYITITQELLHRVSERFRVFGAHVVKPHEET